jgi:hypothetical protein
MTTREREAHGAQSGGAREQEAPAGDPVRGAAARYLDAWEANQAEVARIGPPPGAGLPRGRRA